MANLHKIRWRKSDRAELRRLITNFNAKITRLSKTKPQISGYLPETVKFKEMINLIETRQDLNRELKSLMRFTKRGAEEIVIVPDSYYKLKITKWQRTEMLRRVAIINRRRRKQLEDVMRINMQSRGKELGYTIGEFGMGRADEKSLAPMNAFTTYMNRRDLRMKWKIITRDSYAGATLHKYYILRDSYIKALYSNYNANDIQDVVDYIKKLPIKQFYERFMSIGGTFEEAYIPSREQYNAYLNKLKSDWLEADYLFEKYNTSE